MEINLKLRVEIDASDRLMRILEGLTPSDSPQESAPSSSPEGRELPEAEAKPVEANAEPVEAAEPRYPGDDDLKGSMDMAISKLCGTSDWRNSKDERVLAVKKGCTKAFKEIAKWLGAERPTDLEGAKRNEFIDKLGDIYLEGDREVVYRPF